MNREQLAEMILSRLDAEHEVLATQYANSVGDIGHFYIDDLLPVDIALRIHERFPEPRTMKLKKTLREYKFIAAQMNEYDPILEEAVYAFQAPAVVERVKEICNLKSAYPDVHLYAGGISMMGAHQYLNPHLDNSHDKDRNRWRVLNLLYYVTQDWALENGGNLELWPEGVKGEPVTIHSKFNRLVVMATHNRSWHSVSPIRADNFRCCVSNYYFADEPLSPVDSFHVTSFRGRPEQGVRDVVLRADAALRSGVRKVFKGGIRDNPHVYKTISEHADVDP
jgi:Rps23 Pro-64 3,4-dihydroxylase Tpa1-like proline 4-hydroxylase